VTRAERDLERLLAGEVTGWSYKDLARVLGAAGYQEVSRKGSHRTWKHPADPRLFTIPDHGGGDVAPGYIRAAAKRIAALPRKE
jgi:predicted RNA binding protein YcfA (HicA-like mRNA interferase family)